MARLQVMVAAALGALLAVLHALGGRAATVVLTGSVGPTAPLGVAYVLVWLLVVAVAPTLLLTAVIDALSGALGRSKHRA